MSFNADYWGEINPSWALGTDLSSLLPNPAFELFPDLGELFPDVTPYPEDNAPIGGAFPHHDVKLIIGAPVDLDTVHEKADEVREATGSILDTKSTPASEELEEIVAEEPPPPSPPKRRKRKARSHEEERDYDEESSRQEAKRLKRKARRYSVDTGIETIELERATTAKTREADSRRIKENQELVASGLEEENAELSAENKRLRARIRQLEAKKHDK